MKKIFLFCNFAIIFSGVLFPQATLMFQLHSLQAGYDNPMIFSEYVDPGQGGADMIWDFRQMQEKQSFTGFIKSSVLSEIGVTFPDANTELIEFESCFYFNVNSSQIEEYGYSSLDGKNQTRYTTPFIKLKFPFQFGDSYSGSLLGNSIYNGINNGDISGGYTVEADAYGALILPGDRYLENALRVRSEKNFITDFGSSIQEVNLVTYRWYDLSHRYPLLVLTEYTVKNGSNTTVYHQAAYNNDAVSGIVPVLSEAMSLYPNPTSGELMLKLDAPVSGDLNIAIYSSNGVKVRSVTLNATQSGMEPFDLTDELAGLKPSSYLLIAKNGNIGYRKSFTLIE
jgi:hypothetical protein